MQCAINCMKIGKAIGPSGVAIELFKACGDKRLKFLTNIFNDIFFKDKLPEKRGKDVLKVLKKFFFIWVISLVVMVECQRQ